MQTKQSSEQAPSSSLKNDLALYKQKRALLSDDDIQEKKIEHVELDVDIDTLDMTSDDIDWDEIGEDMMRVKEDSFIQEAIQKGIDIREYSQKIENDLRKIEYDSIDDYLNESERLAHLHSQIKKCDSILEKMEDMLQKFQNSLGNISEAIQTLQDESFSMNIKLKNRKAAEQKLSELLRQITIPPKLVKGVCDKEVNDAYLEYLLELNKRTEFMSDNKYEDAVSIKDVKPKLEMLCNKAVSKVRAFLLQQLAELKKPRTNTQIIKQKVLLKYRYFSEFLVAHNKDAAKEVRASYVDSMGRIYYAKFKTYITNLSKLELKIATKNDVLVEKEGFSFFGTANKTNKGAQIFTLGDRAKILDENQNNIPLVSHAAIEKNEKYPFEVLFRSMTLLLVDTATAEYLFVKDFFGSTDMFDEIFSRSIDLFRNALSTYLSNSYDIIGILIVIRIVRQYATIMEKRGINCLNKYFEELNLMLWPRFKYVFDLNVDSLKNASVANLYKNEVNSYNIGKRYAEFASAIHVLNKDPSYKTQLEGNLKTLRQIFENFLTGCAQKLPDEKSQLVFLINSYDIILTTFIKYNVECEDGVRFHELLETQVEKFIEVELKECYGKLISFVKKTEPLLSKQASHTQNRNKIDTAELEILVKDFERNWRGGIKHSNDNIMKYFSNFKCGMVILRKVLTQLLLYYTRFNSIVYMCYQNPPFRSSLVSSQMIMYEIRQYSKDFK